MPPVKRFKPIKGPYNYIPYIPITSHFIQMLNSQPQAANAMPQAANIIVQQVKYKSHIINKQQIIKSQLLKKYTLSRRR
jgi:hypothetical protein